MLRIKEEFTGVQVDRTLIALRDDRHGLVEFIIENTGSGMTATAVFMASPEDLERVVLSLISAHNKNVDQGLVEALKIPFPSHE